MGLMQEGLRRSGEIRNAFAPANLNPSETKTNRLSLAEPSLEVKIREVSRMLSVQQKEGKETEGLPRPYEASKNGFEPFINGSENDENNLFVNLYGGDFSQKMELNRKGIERVLEIAHLEGKVFFTSLQPNRSSVEAHGNELVAKRFLIFGEKSKEAEEENPYKRVVSVPEGWRIEINNTRITEELTEKKIGGKQLQRAFINRFNGQFKAALKECIWREKCTSEKDKNFQWKVYFSSINPTLALIFSAWHKFDPATVVYQMGTVLFIFSMFNIVDRLRPAPFSRRNIDHVWEFLMPKVEIDKVAKSAIFLAVKGRTLVKEIKQQENK